MMALKRAVPAKIRMALFKVTLKATLLLDPETNNDLYTLGTLAQESSSKPHRDTRNFNLQFFVLYDLVHIACLPVCLSKNLIFIYTLQAPILVQV